MNRRDKGGIRYSKLVAMKMMQECKKVAGLQIKSDNLCFIDAEGNKLVGQPTNYTSGRLAENQI